MCVYRCSPQWFIVYLARSFMWFFLLGQGINTNFVSLVTASGPAGPTFARFTSQPALTNKNSLHLAVPSVSLVSDNHDYYAYHLNAYVYHCGSFNFVNYFTYI